MQNRKPQPATRRRRRPAPARRKAARTDSRIRNFVLPLFLSFCILVCLGALGFLSYRTVTASEFFHVSSIDVRGSQRSSRADIERIVSIQTERTGVWNADLVDMRQRVEKLPFVRSAAVSRALPNGIRVFVNEHVPQAIVRMHNGDFLIGDEGQVLAKTETTEPGLPFVMIGWDENKSEKVGKENLERLRMYHKMLAEWRQFDLASRVKFVDLSDIREPRAVTEDSGKAVSIQLARSDFGEHLKRGINAIVGKGEIFQAVNLIGSNMILEPRKGQ